MRDVSRRSSPTPDVVDRARPRPARSAPRSGRPRSPPRRSIVRLRRRPRARQRRPGRLQAARRRRSSPTSSKLNPLTGFKNIFGPQRALRGRQERRQGRGRRRDRRARACSPSSTSSAALVGMPPERARCRPSRTWSSASPSAPALAYLAHRGRRLRLAALPPREVAEDGQAGGQGGAQEQRAPARGQGRAAPPRQMQAAARPHDGRRPDRRRRRHQPDPLRRRAEVRRRQAAPRWWSPRASDLLALKIREIAAEHGVPIIPDPPLARSLHAIVEVGQQIPEELFQAVAQLLAYVYRIAGARRAAA